MSQSNVLNKAAGNPPFTVPAPSPPGSKAASGIVAGGKSAATYRTKIKRLCVLTLHIIVVKVGTKGSTVF